MCATIVLAGCGTQHASSPGGVTAAHKVAAPTAGSPPGSGG
jgi:hypothetical protein